MEVSGLTKIRAFPTKFGQNISSSVRFTKTRTFAAKSGQNISSSVEVTKSRAFAAKSGQNICRNDQNEGFCSLITVKVPYSTIL